MNRGRRCSGGRQIDRRNDRVVRLNVFNHEHGVLEIAVERLLDRHDIGVGHRLAARFAIGIETNLVLVISGRVPGIKRVLREDAAVLLDGPIGIKTEVDRAGIEGRGPGGGGQNRLRVSAGDIEQLARDDRPAGAEPAKVCHWREVP